MKISAACESENAMKRMNGAAKKNIRFLFFTRNCIRCLMPLLKLHDQIHAVRHRASHAVVHDVYPVGSWPRDRFRIEGGDELSSALEVFRIAAGLHLGFRPHGLSVQS